jgi:hypothetical protein
MTTITTGGSQATLKSVTAEALLAEAFDFLRIREGQPDKNPKAIRNVQTSYNVQNSNGTTGFFSGTFTFNYLRSMGTAGELIVNVPEYLEGVSFSPGSGGTFKSMNAAAYLFEIARFLRALEANPEKNPSNLNNIQMIYYDKESKVAGWVQLPFILSPNSDGSRRIHILPYLL